MKYCIHCVDKEIDNFAKMDEKQNGIGQNIEDGQNRRNWQNRENGRI